MHLCGTKQTRKYLKTFHIETNHSVGTRVTCQKHSGACTWTNNTVTPEEGETTFQSSLVLFAGKKRHKRCQNASGRGSSEVEFRSPPHSSARRDAVVGRLRAGLQRLAQRLVRPLGLGGGLGRPVLHYGLPVVLRVGVLAARQLQECGEAVQVGHLVESAQQQVHHHQAQEQVGCRGGETGHVRVTGGCVVVLCSLWRRCTFWLWMKRKVLTCFFIYRSHQTDQTLRHFQKQTEIPQSSTFNSFNFTEGWRTFCSSSNRN